MRPCSSRWSCWESSSLSDLGIAGEQIGRSVTRVVDQLLAFREELGACGTLMLCGHDWADPALARRSMQLMAEQVMPRVNAAIGES